MEQFCFYLKLGIGHVLDPKAYDHLLFLWALALPFTFGQWKKAAVLATVFTIAHCLSLGLSVFDLLTIDVHIIEFLIPLTIGVTAIFNILQAGRPTLFGGVYLHLLATAFFGLIHGFGFSLYFKLIMAEESAKLIPLFGFASGIEFAQLVVLFVILLFTSTLPFILKLKPAHFVIICSTIVLIITFPLLMNSFPR